MRIASNTIKSFKAIDGHEFLPLGVRPKEVSLIVLMLEKNWGSASVDRIKALTYWIASYPEKIPCYIIGCESTIPIMDVVRYRHKIRDDAVRELCDEVFKRCKTIGVRGKITYEYLTTLLGYSPDRVDLIFEKEANNNQEKIRSFLDKNDCPIVGYLEDILSFQKKPQVQGDHFEKKISISKPYITTDKAAVRLNADIEIDGKTKTLWCETDEMYRHFLLSERCDAFLCVVLPLAMRLGKDIICEAPVSESLLHNLTEVLIPQLCSFDSRLYNIEIQATSDSTQLICGNAVATGLSCGVDSFYTISLYRNSNYKSMDLSHLYCGNYLYGNSGPVYERAELAAQELDLPLIRTGTNINTALRLPHLYTHFFKTMFGVLALRKLFRTYYYSSAGKLGRFGLVGNSTRDTADFELLLLYTFSCPDFQVLTGGGKSDRIEKTQSISSLAAARKYLNVCLDPKRKINCGKCGKCWRTLLTLDMLGQLDSFRTVFNIDEYRRDRLEGLVYLTKQRNSPMLSDVYKHFIKTEPSLMEAASAIYNSQKHE